MSAPRNTSLAVLNKCFVAGTPVLMADGSVKPIEDVEEGDWVLADDPEDGQAPAPREVTAWHLNWTEHLTEVLLDTDGDMVSDGSLKATGEHPFWTQNRGWVDAKELRPGDLLVDASGTTSHVTNTRSIDSVEPTFNLSVEGVHTFFVMAGGESVLVHNTLPGERTYITYQAPDAYGNWYTGRASMPGTLASADDWREVLNYRYAGSNPRGLDFGRAKRLFFGTGIETVGGPKSAANMASRGWERLGYDAMVDAGTAARQNMPLNGNKMKDLYIATARRLGLTVCP